MAMLHLAKKFLINVRAAISSQTKLVKFWLDEMAARGLICTVSWVALQEAILVSVMAMAF